MIKFISLIFGLCMATLAASTQYFAYSVRIMSDEDNGRLVFPVGPAGVVVATGHPGRVTEGVYLLSENHAQRLLISGAGEGVQKSDINKIVTASGKISSDRLNTVMSCCVDLGFDATDTESNATEARVWADKNNLDNLIIVTSDFHMPRAMIAFRSQFPEENLIAHRVRTPWLQLDEDGHSGWWRNLEHISLITGEMIKYTTRRALAMLTQR
jgi:uncharacterized SAM-binding protein YcdF (DUF218 family)